MVAAFMVQNIPYDEYSAIECGQYNGYVAFKEELPPSYIGTLGKVGETTFLDNLIKVHGGISLDIEGLREDVLLVPLTEIPDEVYNYRIIGFDTCHEDDNSEDWSYQEVMEETLSLKSQIEKLITEYYGKED